jgi:23S rRNA pseudouridine1911/1915/1917 synthase
MQAFIVELTDEIRVDVFLASKTGYSRNKIAKAIESGCVSIGKVLAKKSSASLSFGDEVLVDESFFAPKEKPKSAYEPKIVHEDEHIIVIDKPSGIVVHDADGVRESTVVDFLKTKQIPLALVCGENREGIVQRLDKETSGLMVVAKNDPAALALKECIASKDANKLYLAIIDTPLKENVFIDASISRDVRNRVRMKAGKDGKESKTAFFKLATSKDGKSELVLAKLFTGRTHQIRAHLALISRHVIGDDLYGFKSRNANIRANRMMLHAYILQIIHPSSGKKISFLSKPDGEFERIIKESFDKEIIDEIITQEHICNLANTDICGMLTIKSSKQ